MGGQRTKWPRVPTKFAWTRKCLDQLNRAALIRSIGRSRGFPKDGKPENDRSLLQGLWWRRSSCDEGPKVRRASAHCRARIKVRGRVASLSDVPDRWCSCQARSQPYPDGKPPPAAATEPAASRSSSPPEQNPPARSVLPPPPAGASGTAGSSTSRNAATPRPPNLAPPTPPAPGEASPPPSTPSDARPSDDLDPIASHGVSHVVCHDASRSKNGRPGTITTPTTPGRQLSDDVCGRPSGCKKNLHRS